MYPAKFEYRAVASVEEAVGLLEADQDAKLIAGGHSLLPMMKLRLAQPSMLVDIGKIASLKFVRAEADALVIGAMATYRDVQFSSDAKSKLPILGEAIEHIGDLQVRARGTLVGSLAHADPAGDMPAVVLALGGSATAVGPNGSREVAFDDLFVDMLTTSLEPSEILTEVRIPYLAPKTGASYQKFDQPASHYAICGVCAVVTLAADGSIASARIGIAGVGPKAYRATSVEAALVGKQPTEADVKAAGESAAEGIDVMGDIHAGVDYRSHLAKVYARRAVLAAAAKA